MNIFKIHAKAVVFFAIAAKATLAQMGPAVVEVSPLAEIEIASTQATLGSIMPTKRAVIGSAVDGRVVEFLVREGDLVQKDQPLASLLTRTIELELEAADAELELRNHELDELRNGSRPEEIVQAKARMEANGIVVQYLEREKLRLSALDASNSVSLSELENALSKWLEAQQSQIETKSAYQLAVDGPRPEKLKQAEARVAMTQAICEKLRDQIAKHTMYSRFTGYVTAEFTEVGQWLARGESVAEIIALDEVFVVAKVIEAHIPFIHVNEVVTLDVPALGDRKFSGVVEAIVPEADVRSRTFPVKVRVKNEFNAAGEPLLKAGMLARASLATNETHKAIVVHKDALVLNGATTVVWTIDRASIEPGLGNMVEANAVAVPVQTGAEVGNLIEVLGNVNSQMDVIVRGNERIRPSRPGMPPSRVTWMKKSIASSEE
ncbi:MAG: efflux RND transporter periplasmic adaptor subunit [Pirellulaceae bacterium]|nr:efflux RND transporter periplasmic adaptor subunit [Pirellulaceae bacterium]